METSVIIPTYKRTDDLKRCLEGLSRQFQVPDEVIVVVRDIDDKTRNFLEEYQSTIHITTAIVNKPGQVAALNTGLQKSSGEFICILDDDTVPHIHWLQKILDIFKSSEQIGGVGGRDWVIQGNHKDERKKDIVGKVQWFGRVIGNHHLGYGEARDVDVLKGANMSYRRKAIEGILFDERLLGQGAQVHNDMAFSLSVRKRGWRLVYDPDVGVDHYPAPRFDLDQRGAFNKEAYLQGIFNETLILSEYMSNPFQKKFYIIWSILIGTSDKPGLLQLIRFLNKNPKPIFQKFSVNIHTRLRFQKKLKTLVRS
ncbi:glycosyltransferase family 2 protein [Niallia circulans]|uniref:glycosyltransferase family 2 protein n=1 Tax=Niallia circulans TaxID=1397 RepID=UPI001F3726A1|nr:glycosyltransferase family 2 protein [Niallia circulans]MCF2649159.1 glycosyltransferase family 2 protein [Niallia circulans]